MARDRGSLTWVQALGLVIGGVYLLIGVVGFFLIGFDGFFEMGDETLLGFMINPAHNVVHVLIGIAGLALSRTLAGARTKGGLLAVGYGAAFIYGPFAVGNPDINFLNINAADNVLRAVCAIAGLVLALAPVKSDARRGTVV